MTALDVREWRVSPSNPAVVEAVCPDGSVETVARTVGPSREALAAQMVREHTPHVDLPPNAWGEPRPNYNVYVRTLNCFRPGLGTEEVESTGDTVRLDWDVADDGSAHLAGVEVMAARGVEVDGIDVRTGRPHGVDPEAWEATLAAETEER